MFIKCNENRFRYKMTPKRKYNCYIAFVGLYGNWNNLEITGIGNGN